MKTATKKYKVIFSREIEIEEDEFYRFKNYDGENEEEQALNMAIDLMENMKGVYVDGMDTEITVVK